MPSLFTSARTLAGTRSLANSGACTPTIASPLSRNLLSRDATHGSDRTQLIQPKVQTSRTTTFPLRSESRSGGALIQRAGSRVGKSGAGRAISLLAAADPASSLAPAAPRAAPRSRIGRALEIDNDSRLRSFGAIL